MNYINFDDNQHAMRMAMHDVQMALLMSVFEFSCYGVT